jgi:hypothetical protein
MSLGKGILAIVGCSVLVLLGVGLALNGRLMVEAWQQKKQVEQIVQEFGTYVARSDFERAYTLCTSEFRDATPHEEFVRQQLSLCQSNGALKLIQITGLEVEGTGEPAEWVAVVRADMHFHLRTLPLTLELHRPSSGWAINGYKVQR